MPLIKNLTGRRSEPIMRSSRRLPNWCGIIVVGLSGISIIVQCALLFWLPSKEFGWELGTAPKDLSHDVSSLRNFKTAIQIFNISQTRKKCNRVTFVYAKIHPQRIRDSMGALQKSLKKCSLMIPHSSPFESYMQYGDVLIVPENQPLTDESWRHFQDIGVMMFMYYITGGAKGDERYTPLCAHTLMSEKYGCHPSISMFPPLNSKIYQRHNGMLKEDVVVLAGFPNLKLNFLSKPTAKTRFVVFDESMSVENRIRIYRSAKVVVIGGLRGDYFLMEGSLFDTVGLMTASQQERRSKHFPLLYELTCEENNYQQINGLIRASLSHYTFLHQQSHDLKAFSLDLPFKFQRQVDLLFHPNSDAHIMATVVSRTEVEFTPAFLLSVVTQLPTATLDLFVPNRTAFFRQHDRVLGIMRSYGVLNSVRIFETSDVDEDVLIPARNWVCLFESVTKSFFLGTKMVSERTSAIHDSWDTGSGQKSHAAYYSSPLIIYPHRASHNIRGIIHDIKEHSTFRNPSFRSSFKTHTRLNIRDFKAKTETHFVDLRRSSPTIFNKKIFKQSLHNLHENIIWKRCSAHIRLPTWIRKMKDSSYDDL